MGKGNVPGMPVGNGRSLSGESDKRTKLTVRCYAGYRGEEEPREFALGERRVQVVDVLDRWLDPDHRYFKVLGSDGDTYILRHDVRAERWELTMYVKG